MGLLSESLVGGLAAEAAVGSVVVVVVLPLAELVVEQVGVVDDDPVEEPVELFGVDAVGSLHLSVQPWGAGFDVDVLGAFIQGVPVEVGAELGAVEFLSDVKVAQVGWRVVAS